MSRISTVNVIEYVDNTVQQIISFEDTVEGNIEAEKMFVSFASINSCPKKDIINCINDGIYEDGSYQVFIVHSY
jgi:hypothetical protein